MKRFLALLVSLLLVFSLVVSADELDKQAIIDRYVTDGVDSDRIYKYDYIAKKEVSEDTQKETINYKNAVNVVLALELMYKDSKGNFNENDFVPYGDFANIIMMIGTGTIEEISEQYKNYPSSRFATQHEAAYYLVSALGYDIYDSKYKGENPRSMNAQKIGLLDGIDFVGDKNITRGELAQMIYNALQIDVVDQTAFGDVDNYEIIEGNTLLDRFYDSEIVYGMVTAQNGFDLYSNSSSLKSHQIKINNALYNANSVNLSKDYLGHNVIALIKKAPSGSVGSIEMLEFDEFDEAVAISAEALSDIRGNYVYYETEEGTKKLSINSADRVVLNGEAVVASELTDLLLSDFEGEVRFCSENGGKTDTVVIYSYSTYKVASNSALNEKISFADGRTYNGNTFISYEDEENIRVTKNGEPAAIADIAAGHIISIVQNPAKTRMIIKLSTKSVTGVIESIEDDKFFINGVPYEVSYAYEESRKNNKTIKELTINTSGKFLLDCEDRIVSMSSDGGEYLYAFMTKIGQEGGLDSKVLLRAFTMDNEWQSLELADKLTLDGNAGVTREDAFTQLKKNEETICNNPIRYKLSKGQVTFLDTLYQTPAESGDNERMRQDSTWTGEFNWSVSYTRIYLRGNVHSLSKQTKVFTVPEDLTQEEKGFSYGTPAFVIYTDGNLKIYNSDDFYVSPLVVSISGGGAAANFADVNAWSVVCGRFQYVDEEGEIRNGIKIFDGATPPHWAEVKLRIDDKILEQADTLKIGDIINVVTDGKVLKAFQMTRKLEEIDTDSTNGLWGVSGQAITVGSVVDVDIERELVKILCNGEEAVYKMHSLAMFEKDTGKCSMIELGDLEVGDRVFCAGGSQLMRIVVYR